jgi:hypothetical protein
MNKNSEKIGVGPQKSKLTAPEKSSFWKAAIIVAALSLGVGLAYQAFKKTSEQKTRPDSRIATLGQDFSAERSPVTESDSNAKSSPGSNASAKAFPNRNPRSPSGRETHDQPIVGVASSTEAAQKLIANLSSINLSRGPLSSEQVKELNQNIKKIASQGVAAIPAIKEFLERNQDLNFSELSGGNPTDYPSLRLGLIDALQKIGGPEAIEVGIQTLQTTADPLEVGMLVRNLEKQAPEQYRELELKAAREAFSMAANLQSDGRNLNPLFEVFQKYGDDSVVPDLEKAVLKKDAWKYQAAMALSELPDGIGLPALIKLAQNPEVNAQDSGDLALRALAQVATKYPEARTALLEQARANQIPAIAWPAIASALAGTYVFAYGHKVFGLPENLPILTDPQVPERLAVIDELLAANPSPEALAALQQQRVALASRLQR